MTYEAGIVDQDIEMAQVTDERLDPGATAGDVGDVDAR